MQDIHILIKQFNDSRQAGDHDKTFAAIQAIRARPEALSPMMAAELLPQFQNYEIYHQKFEENRTNQKLMAKFAAKVAERNSPEAVFAKAENLRVERLRAGHKSKSNIAGQNLKFSLGVDNLERDNKEALPGLGKQIVDNLGIDRAGDLTLMIRELAAGGNLEKRDFIYKREFSFSSNGNNEKDMETARELVNVYGNRANEILQGIKKAVELEGIRSEYLKSLL